jgi:hypothetical protein
MIHLDIRNINYGQKKSRNSNRQFDSRPLKVRSRPDFLLCRWRVTYRLEALDKGYNSVIDFISIEGLHTKLWAPKVAGLPTLGNFWKSRNKMSFRCWSVDSHRVYYKGEGGAFPQVRAVVSLVSPSLPVAHPNTKSVSIMH